MSSRRTCWCGHAIAALLALGTLSNAESANAWEYLNPPGSCSSTRWEETPHIKLRWPSSTGVTADEQNVIEAAIAQFNYLFNGKVYVYEAASTDNCTAGVDPPAGTICIYGDSSPCGDSDYAGCTVLNATTGSSCTHDGCRIAIKPGQATINMWRVTSHELSHCFGLDHTPDPKDWLSAGLQAQQHAGTSRDTMNGWNYLYAFGSNFYFGDFSVSSNGDTDILTRDNQNTSNTVPWYLTTQNSLGDSWTDSGQKISDFGNETTLAYVTGDFDGDGCPDVARGLCDGCDPGDGAGDTVEWSVTTSNCGSGFNTGTSWSSNFGDAEDYDQYKVGDFDGDGCDDVWLIRNDSARDCSFNSNCAITIWWMLARRPNGNSCAGSGSAPDHFVTHSTQYSIPASIITDRNGPVAWPWVVGDFYTDSLDCYDLAVGMEDPYDPRVMAWYVFKAVDTNSNALCDNLATTNEGNAWDSSWGTLGQRYVFAAEAGNGGADDIIRLNMPVSAGLQEVRWSIGYSNGSNALTNKHTPLTDHLITGSEAHWTGMVFGVGNFDSVNGNYVDFITLRGANSTGAVKAKIAYRTSGSGSWTLSAYGSDVALPTAKSEWKQPTDNDFDTVKDNGGDDAKDAWWCQDCDEWYCQACTGCCP